MDNFFIHIGPDQPAEYLIKIQGRLERDLADWFQEPPACSWEFEGQNPRTVIQGVVADQAALHGLLNFIRNLGLTLLYVDCLEARRTRDTKS